MNPASSLFDRSRRGLALLGVAVALAAGGAAALWGRHDAGPPAMPDRGGSATTAPPAAPALGAALAWPVAPYTAEQIAAARGCALKALEQERYPADLASADLPARFAARTACDHAALAAACAARVKGHDAPPPACVDAYLAAVRANPAFAFIDNLPGGYFGAAPLVAPPPVAGRPIVAVTVAYTWGGYGEPVAWIASVRDATPTPTIAITGAFKAAAKPAADLAAKLAALGTSLDSLLPIPAPLRATACTDNQPDWTVTLEFAGGGRLVLFTHGSNVLHLGGPWQATIDGVTYLQLAPSFMTAVTHLATTLDLPLGEPAGTTCRGYDLAAAAFGD
jgi:hypothetical protein